MVKFSKQELIECAARAYLSKPLPPFWENLTERKLMAEIAHSCSEEFTNTAPEMVWQKIVQFATHLNQTFVLGEDYEKHKTERPSIRA